MDALSTGVVRTEKVAPWTDGEGEGGGSAQIRLRLPCIWRPTLSNVNGRGRTKLKWA